MHPGSVSSAAERIAFDEIENYSRPADRFSLAFMRLPIACLNGLFLFGRRSLYTRGWNGDIYICPYYNIDAILFIWCNKLQAHKYEIGLAREKRRNSESECRENGKIGSWSVFGSQMCVDTMCSAHCWHFDGKMAIECSEELQCSWFKDSCFSWFFSAASTRYHNIEKQWPFSSYRTSNGSVLHNHFKSDSLFTVYLWQCTRYHLLPIRIVRKLFDYMDCTSPKYPFNPKE